MQMKRLAKKLKQS